MNKIMLNSLNRILIIIFLGFETIIVKNVFLFLVRLLQMMIVLEQFHKCLMPFFLNGGNRKKGEGWLLKGEGNDSL